MSILVAMSGGVDSSVSAYLMREKYKTCRGATMLLFLNESLGISSRHPCCSRENIIDAKAICDILGIEHEVINYMPDFEERVIKKFVRVYEEGGTPNPCVDCNKFMKFEALLNHARSSGLERIATGHYARIERESSGRYLLRKAKDLSRDQSYVLYMLSQSQLANIDFPLGSMTKPEVRELAEELKFTNARKHDSQDICFIHDGDYAGFIESYTGKKYLPGSFIDSQGRVIGNHRGIIHYTTGQRRGLGVAAGSRLYVSSMNINDNTITLVPESESLLARGVIASDINIISGEKIHNLNARVKTRYRQREIPAIINQSDNNELIIEFRKKQKTPAIGQAVVIYDDGDSVIGGGTITQIIYS